MMSIKKLLRNLNASKITNIFWKKICDVSTYFFFCAAISATALTACSKGGSDFAPLGVVPQDATDCTVTTTNPSIDNVTKVSNTAGTLTAFTVGLSSSTCSVKFSLNGNALSSTGTTLSLDSSLLNPGINTLTATSGSSTKTWSVVKNNPPVCGSQTPAATGNSMAPGANMVLNASASDADGDAMTFSWKINNAAASSSILNAISNSTSSQAIFTPTSSYLGSNSLVLAVSDGVDTAQCSWTVDVSSGCSIASTSPSTGATVKIAQGSTSNSLFQVSAPGCSFSWKLNGTTQGGQTASSYALDPTSLSPGTYSLQVTATNGSTSDTRTWNVLKNSAPICSGQTPSSTGTIVAVGSSQNFVANAVDANSDSLTYAWYDNGAAVGAQYAITSGANSSTAAMTANGSLVGTHVLRADISDGLDTSSCSWTATVKAPCQISSATPGSSTLKMPFNPAANQNFIATPNDASCALTWKLNGSVLSGATAALYTLSSSQLNPSPATNTLTATAADGYTSDTKTWTLTKNVAPTCSSQTPTTTGSSVGVGGNQTYAAVAGNTDSDALTYSWIYNGSAVNPAYFSVSSSGNNTQAVFTPTASQAGNNQSLSVTISDGYDTASCSWTTNVVNSCSITSASPGAATVRIAHLATTSNSFSGIPSDSSCASTWTLNGTTVSTGPILALNSSGFLDAPSTNTLTLTLDNGISAPVTRTWTVTKNRPPTCSTQTPAANPAAMPYTSTRNFSGTTLDADGDTLTGFNWLFNSSTNAALFSASGVSSGVASTTFSPTFSQVGSAQNVAVQFTDGYDAGQCSWSFDVTNPNTVSITSCLPNANPIVVYSTGVNSTQTLQVVASNATSNGYSWYQNSSLINGVTANSYAVSAGTFSAGNYTFRGVASDAQGNTAYCDYNVKVNAAPNITVLWPTNGQTYRLNYGSTMSFGVTASDANSDTLSYTWTLDGAANAALGSGSASTILNPNYNPSLIGTHTITVAVSDGYETVQRNWNVEINLFSPSCNALYNSNTSGGQVCTLVGVPGMGSGLIPSADQTLIRTQPAYIIDDGAGNWIYTDQLNHTVNFFNRSGASITRWGMTLPAGAMTVVMGNGANGLTIDGLYNRQFKLDTPMGLSYDTATKNLYIADYNNHRVVMMDNTGIVATVVGSTTGAALSNNTANNTDGNLGTSAACSNPTDVRIVNYGGARDLYISCYGTNAIKRMDALPSSPNYQKVYMVVGHLTSGATAAGTANGTLGTTGASTTKGPWALGDDGNGNIYWTEYSGYRVRAAATGGSALSFFGGSVTVAANQSTSLFGSTATNSINPTASASVAVGAVTLRSPRGLAVLTSGSTVLGFFVSAYDQHRVIFVNNTASTLTFGGSAVAGNSAAVVLGTGTAGFNADGLGNTSRVQTVHGVSVSSDQNSLLVADYANYRARDMDLSSSNGQITTEIGAGRARSGSLGDSPIAATGMYLNGPTGMIMDSTNRKLYVSDSQNSRIRRVDMMTGYVDTIIGKGLGGGTVEAEDPTNAYLAYPRGLTMMTASGTNFLVYADQQQSAGANKNCQVRALNMTPNIGNPPAINLLGISIPAYKVSTLAGDYVTGCVSQAGASANTSLGAATNAALNYSEGIATDGTNLFIVNYNDHCIMKVDASGQASVIVGTCGTAGTADGSTSLATLRYPTAIVMDPAYPGNFFVADAPDQNPTRIRYVNFRTSSVTIGNFTVPAAVAPYAQVTTLWTIGLGGGGRVYGLAAFDSQFCIAGGYPGNGDSGTHNVTCYDRSTSLSPVTLRVGPNEASSPAFRAGAPLTNTEQEGIAATSAFLNGPYGITFDSSGNLYIAERNNHIIRMVRRWW